MDARLVLGYCMLICGAFSIRLAHKDSSTAPHRDCRDPYLVCVDAQDWAGLAESKTTMFSYGATAAKMSGWIVHRSVRLLRVYFQLVTLYVRFNHIQSLIKSPSKVDISGVRLLREIQPPCRERIALGP